MMMKSMLYSHKVASRVSAFAAAGITGTTEQFLCRWECQASSFTNAGLQFGGGANLWLDSGGRKAGYGLRLEYRGIRFKEYSNRVVNTVRIGVTCGRRG